MRFRIDHHWTRFADLRLAMVPLFGALGLLSACATSGRHETGFDQLTLAPGDTGTCESNPCRVFLKIPAGSGSYEVTGNQVKVGTYPAGQTADLGSYFSSQAFQIVGMDVPKAYAYVPADI
jgi:hypothetical protein